MIARVRCRASVTTLLFLLAAGSGCAIRVTGTVRDAQTGAAIGGAVVKADDGRNRTSVTDPAGAFTIKTDSDTPSIAVSAPGYTATTARIPTGDDAPVVAVALQPVAGGRAPSAGGTPLVPRLGAGGGAAAGATGTASKLKELQSLYDGGLISEAEYKAMRSRVVEGF